MDYLRSLARSSSASSKRDATPREESPISDIDEGEGESKIAIDAGIKNVLDAMNRHNAARAGAEQPVGQVGVRFEEAHTADGTQTGVVDDGKVREEQHIDAKGGKAQEQVNAGDVGSQVKDADPGKQTMDDDIVMEDALEQHHDKGKQKAVDESRPSRGNDINTPLQQRHEREQRPPTPELFRGHSRNPSSSSSSATITSLPPADTVHVIDFAVDTQRRQEASPTPAPEVPEEIPATPPPPPAQVKQQTPTDGATGRQSDVQTNGHRGNQNDGSQSAAQTSGPSGSQNDDIQNGGQTSDQSGSQSAAPSNDQSGSHIAIKYYDEDEDMQVVGENIRSPPLPPPKPETIKIDLKDFNGYVTFFSCKPTSKPPLPYLPFPILDLSY